MSSATTIRMCYCGVAHAEGIPCDQVPRPIPISQLTAADRKKYADLMFYDGLAFFFKNLWHWRTAWAVRHLSKQLQRDKAFRDSWQANIAMPIYDALRPQCLCHLTEENFHKWDCEQMRGRTASECRNMPAAQANYIADRLMEHLFDA